MYGLHSEGPALELTPDVTRLSLKTQACDFTVDGNPIDPRQCIKRIVATNGAFISIARNRDLTGAGNLSEKHELVF